VADPLRHQRVHVVLGAADGPDILLHGGQSGAHGSNSGHHPQRVGVGQGVGGGALRAEAVTHREADAADLLLIGVSQ
jgi:hypothetical protein